MSRTPTWLKKTNLKNLESHSSTKNSFNEDYFENGEELGLSGYSNYKWMPERTIPFCHTIAQYLDIKREDSILDYGCAKGFMVKAFRLLGYQAYGVDISSYALTHCDHEVKSYLYMPIGDYSEGYDWIISKDVLEHVPYDEIDKVISSFSSVENVFIVVPLGRDEKYNVPEYEEDVTHHIREPASWWINKFDEHGYDIYKFSNQVKWMKDNWAQYENGNGFFTFKKRK